MLFVKQNMRKGLLCNAFGLFIVDIRFCSKKGCFHFINGQNFETADHQIHFDLKIIKQGKNAFSINPPSNFLHINWNLCF